MSAEADTAPAEPREITLKLTLPKCISKTQEVLEIPSGLNETLNDLNQALQILPATRNLTNYDVYLGNENISERFDEISSYESILQSLDLSLDVTEISIHLREKAYNLAAVYDQITRFREVIGLHYVDSVSSDFGAAAGVSRFNDLGLSSVKERNVEEKEEKPASSDEKDASAEKETAEASKAEEIPEEDLATIVSIAKNIVESKHTLSEHADFTNINENIRIPIRSLSVSQWSPVASIQKTKGDLLYLTLQTLENEVFNITCHFSGFYVNSSSSVKFNPAIKVNEKGKLSKDFLLYNLVDSISSQFSKVITDNELVLSNKTEYPESYLLANNSLSAPWLVNASVVKILPDSSRFQLPLLQNAVDGSDYIRDWNGDIQSIRELPSTTFQERILKEKIIHKNLADFTKCATETAINIIKGNLTAMDPNEELDKQIFLKNGIFYTSGSTSVDLFEATGGIEASRYTANKDISAIKVLNRVDSPGVHSLVTCIVDYMGRRVVCQAPVPGIFNQVSESQDGEDEKVAYGLSSDNSRILRDTSFDEPLNLIADTFHLKQHTVELGEIKSDGPLIVSKDTKGIHGTDGRKYVIDLYRTVPRDIEFTQSHFDGSETSYPHGESLVRHEAVAEWWKRNITTFIREETSKEGQTDEEKAQFKLPTDRFVFNPDAFSTDNEQTEDKDVVTELSKFVKVLIEEFLAEAAKSSPPFDGKHLSDLLHKNGINLRYLGYVATQAESLRLKALKDLESKISANVATAAEEKKKEEERRIEDEKNKTEGNEEKDAEVVEENKVEQKEEKKTEEEEESKEASEEPEATSATFEPIVSNFAALHTVAVQEMIARAVKHILRKLSSNVPAYLMPNLVAHFHNCLLASSISASPVAFIDEDIKPFISAQEIEFTKLDAKKVSQLVAHEVFTRFRFTLSPTWVADVRPVQLLREIALKFGIQWESQDYAFTSEDLAKQNEILERGTIDEVKVETAKSGKNGKHHKNGKNVNSSAVTPVVNARKYTFSPSDIVNFVPIVKDSDYKSSIMDEIFQTARVHIDQGDRDTGISLLNELMNIQEQVYGVVSAETVGLYTSIAQIFAELGMEFQAALVARKAIIISERTTGFDSYDTITAYMNSGYYESSNMELVNSLKLYQQAISIWSQVYGRDHPTLITTLSNMAGNMMQVKLYPSAAKFYQEALELSIENNGQISEITGSIYHSFALLLLNSSKFKESLDYFLIAADIFTKCIGYDDVLTKQSAKYADSIAKYIEFLKLQEEQKKQLAKAAASERKQAKVTVQKKAVKSPSPKQTHPANPEIASQSVEDILKFIEGDKTSKKSKKGKKSKK